MSAIASRGGPTISTLARNARLAPLIAACEKRVVSRQWATSDIWSPEPLWFERHRYGKGRKLAAQPAKNKDAHLYGYDARGIPARVRQWSGFLGKWHEEELYVPDGNVLVRYRFRTDGKLMNVERFSHDDDGRPVLQEVAFVESKKSATQKFVWKDGLLVRVDAKNWGASYKLTWTALGELEAIFEVWKGRPHEIYRRPKKGETLAGLLAIIRERLLAIIPRAVAKAKPKSEAYALMLVCDEEEWRHALPPSLTLAFEEDRVRLAKSYGDRMADVMWSAPEIDSEIDLSDARLDAACKRANQIVWRDSAHAKVTRFVRAVAKELQALDWSKLRKVNDDFVVYATRLEGDGELDVRRDAPPAIKKRLVARGLL